MKANSQAIKKNVLKTDEYMSEVLCIIYIAVCCIFLYESRYFRFGNYLARKGVLFVVEIQYCWFGYVAASPEQVLEHSRL